MQKRHATASSDVGHNGYDDLIFTSLKVFIIQVNEVTAVYCHSSIDICTRTIWRVFDVFCWMMMMKSLADSPQSAMNQVARKTSSSEPVKPLMAQHLLCSEYRMEYSSSLF
ncbi:hypothetical protein OUZ56_020416 [Daphnia magna]|uniref:Uncharacterized protein n=1 Tax=Daphnia magna TaxID=35525 RepID=A0ABQ9ZEF2_9CRUS|nr:hypothetical protein OUZ56_020416 [Daphnia magna]